MPPAVRTTVFAMADRFSCCMTCFTRSILSSTVRELNRIIAAYARGQGAACDGLLKMALGCGTEPCPALEDLISV